MSVFLIGLDICCVKIAEAMLVGSDWFPRECGLPFLRYQPFTLIIPHQEQFASTELVIPVQPHGTGSGSPDGTQRPPWILVSDVVAALTNNSLSPTLPFLLTPFHTPTVLP